MASCLGGPGPLPSQAAPTGVTVTPWWHLPPSAQGDAVLMAPVTAAPRCRVSPGTTGSGGGEMRKMKHREEEQRVPPPNQPDPPLCVFLQQPSCPSCPTGSAARAGSTGNGSAWPPTRVLPSLAPKPSPAPSSYAILGQQAPEPAQRPPRCRL